MLLLQTGRINCERHCGERASGAGSMGPEAEAEAVRNLRLFWCVAGIFQYKTISCTDCTDSHVVCFGYNCK